MLNTSWYRQVLSPGQFDDFNAFEEFQFGCDSLHALPVGHGRRRYFGQNNIATCGRAPHCGLTKSWRPIGGCTTTNPAPTPKLRRALGLGISVYTAFCHPDRATIAGVRVVSERDAWGTSSPPCSWHAGDAVYCDSYGRMARAYPSAGSAFYLCWAGNHPALVLCDGWGGEGFTC